jgi:hypothetical protein
MNQIININKNTEHLIEISNPTKFANRKINTRLRLYCKKLLENNVTSYLGTILFHAEELNPWQEVNKTIDELVTYLSNYNSLINLWICIEVHRSRPKEINSLHGRPHIHFIISLSGQNYLGPEYSDLEKNIQEMCYDLTLKLIPSNLKNYLNAHKYLFKEIKKDDILPYLNQINKHHLNSYMYCLDLIPYIEDIVKAMCFEFGGKLELCDKLNKYNKLWQTTHTIEDYIIYAINYYMEKNNIIYNNQHVLQLKSDMQYTYDIYQHWSEFKQDLKFKGVFKSNLQIGLDHVLRSRIDLSFEMKPQELSFDYIEFNDAIYSLKEDKWYNKEEFKDFNLKLRMSFSAFKKEIINKDMPAINNWLKQNSINISEFLFVMGALLHEREHIRDVPTPILYGSPGTGKSFLVSLYNKLLGAENMGYLSASKLFAFQDLVNKRLGAFEDIEWEQKAVMLKHMFEGAPLKVDQKYKPIAELILARSIVTTNHLLRDFFNKEDADALEDRSKTYNFFIKLNKISVEDIKEDFPRFIHKANKKYLDEKVFPGTQKK